MNTRKKKRRRSNADVSERCTGIQERWFSTTEAAEYLGISGARVRQFCLEGRIGGLKAGNFWIFSERDLREFSMIPRPSGRPRS